MVKYKCQCCGFEQEFADAEEAFHAGWDTPPHLTGYIACNLCPASYLVLGIDHSKIHENWQRDGRPKEFNCAACVLPEGEIDEQLQRKSKRSSQGSV